MKEASALGSGRNRKERETLNAATKANSNAVEARILGRRIAVMRSVHKLLTPFEYISLPRPIVHQGGTVSLTSHAQLPKTPRPQADRSVLTLHVGFGSAGRIAGRSEHAIAKNEHVSTATVTAILDEFAAQTLNPELRKRTLALELGRLDAGAVL